jgi:hypothetical protein
MAKSVNPSFVLVPSTTAAVDAPVDRLPLPDIQAAVIPTLVLIPDLDQYLDGLLDHYVKSQSKRQPKAFEEHFPLEEELLALAESEDRLHSVRAPEQASNPQQSKIAPVKQVAPWPRWEPVRHPGGQND